MRLTHLRDSTQGGCGSSRLLQTKATIGRRTFEVAAGQTWNGLPEDVTSSPTLSIFRSRLKTHLIRRSHPDIVLLPEIICNQAFFCYLGHFLC